MQLDEVLSEVARRISREMAALEELFKSFVDDGRAREAALPAPDTLATLDGVSAAEPQPT